MKAFKKYLLVVFLVLSLLGNALLYYYLVETNKPSFSILKLELGENNTVIYCEQSADSKSLEVDLKNRVYKIDKATLISKDDGMYLVTLENEINLSEYEGSGFVINSNGELLYSLNTPRKKQAKVYITPSGRKYHTDPDCAGTTGFEIVLETAKLLRKPCSICA